jgi:molybdate transport system ATP-binding protein
VLATALLLLDEPLGALDLPLRRKILPWLLRLREAFDVPMVFVSHDATEVLALCDEVLVLDEGLVEARGPTARTLRTRQRPGERFENLLRGRVVATDGSGGGSAQVELAPGIRLRIAPAGLRAGADVRVLIDADDVLVALQPPTGLSARNVLRAHLASLRNVAGMVHAELALYGAPQAEPLLASLTEEAARELGLAAGLELWAVFKSSSCRVLAAGATPCLSRRMQAAPGHGRHHARLGHQLHELARQQRLRPVAARQRRLLVHLDRHAVGPGRDGRARERRDDARDAGRVRGVDDDGQVRPLASSGSTVRSSVLRVAFSKVRMPRSQRMTCSQPPSARYSAA